MRSLIPKPPRAADPSGPRSDRPRSSLRRVTAPLAVVTGTVALLAGVLVQAEQPATGRGVANSTVAPLDPVAEAAAQVAAAPTPRLVWKPCKGRPKYQCTRVRVPLDYDLPKGATVSLRLARLPARDQARRMGSVFLNPGGPGGSGVQLILSGSVDGAYTRAVRDRFDIVSFDPRGIADSTGVQCFDSTEAAAANRPPFEFPYNVAQERQWVAADRGLSRACVQRAGAIIDHMSTANVARDLDVLRRASGDQQLNFVGFSYGSFIGSTYANLFPDKVRAIIIDGVLDPISWATGRGDESRTRPTFDRVGSAAGMSETFGQFLDLCKKGGKNCAFSAGNPAARFEALTGRLLKSGPITLPPDTPEGDKVQVSYQSLVQTVFGVMYAPAGWPALAQFLHALDTGNLPAAAEALATLNPAPQESTGYQQILDGTSAVTCSDSDNPGTSGAWAAAAQESERRAPHFGRAWAWLDSVCASWPGQDEDRYTGPFDTVTAHPLLVMSTRYDPATPYAGAVSASKILPGSRLLTVNGWGHITAQTGSRCADRHAATYLLTGVLPPEGTVCAPDEVPFAAPSKGAGS
jgi:pimeloyl-ACP methyl ester carboxylesterase